MKRANLRRNPAPARVLLVLACLGPFAAPDPVLARLGPAQLDQLPPPATRPVDFARDVQPILEASCIKCHGRGKSKGGFQLDTRETFLRDADSGPAVVVGRSRESLLVHLVSGLDPDNVMPVKGTKLTAEQVGILRAWIDQGLPWPDGIGFAREPHRHLQPRKPDLPAATDDLAHPVDRLLAPYFARHGITAPPPVDDRLFARRAYLDLGGLLPTPDELDAFLSDNRPDRRERLVRQLLADSSRYAQHWLTFWNDLLRNDYRGTGYIDGGREQITRWLYRALRDNQPYDQFVRELVNPGDGPARGFVKGIVWRGAVNASQTPQMQAAQNIAQVFLGVNLKCASCHDSFIDDWQLADAYGMAGIYADEKLELVQCDKPLGKHVPVKFVFPELGALDDDAPKAQRVARLAELLTSPDNGRLPRTIVNRLWSRFFGRGLVEPVDVMQNPAWHPDLLDWLAEDLVTHGYNLKRTMEVMLTSRAYRLPAVAGPAAESSEPFVFRGPAVRRLSAEQFRDALAQLTGVWHEKPEGGIDTLLVETADTTKPPVDPLWIWSDPHAAQAAPPGTNFFRRSFVLTSIPVEAAAFLNADNAHRFWVNGRETPRRGNPSWEETTTVDLRPLLRVGTNTFAIEAVNGGDGPNPAGLLFYARLRLAPADSDPISPAGTPAVTTTNVLDLASDGAWLTSTRRFDRWHQPDFDDSAWSTARVLGPDAMAPWNLGTRFAALVSGRPVYGTVRTALVAADPLTLALGRPNREQTTTERSSLATTLQLLELTNGATLAQILEQGARQFLIEQPDGPRLVREVFRRGLGRVPTEKEAALSLALVGRQPTNEGVQDLLWSVAMLPEFQLLH